MSRRASLFTVVLFSCIAEYLFAQSPTKPAGELPSPVPSLTPPASPIPTIKALVDSMDAIDLKEAIQLLKNNYIKPDALNETELNRATFEGILARLGRGVVLLSDSAQRQGDTQAAFYGEVLEAHIGYLRPGALNRQNLEALDTNLTNLAAKKVDALVIDLRAGPAANDFSIAAEFAKRFCPKGKLLFTLRKTGAKQERSFSSDRDPAYEGMSIILVDGDTAGAAEVLAGVIHFYEKALVIGQATAGQAVEYSDLKLPSGKVLRVAVSETILPENQSLFPNGLKPDVPVEMPAADKRDVFQMSREKGMTSFVVDSERPHLNEAALIAGKNPELEAMELAQRRGSSTDKAIVHDPVLQRALDLITTITIFQHK